MKHITALAGTITAITLAAASTVSAQTRSSTKIFLDVNVGAQTQARTVTTSTSFPLYGETAVISGAESVDGGPIFDIAGGYRAVRNLSVGVGFSHFSKSGDGSLIASIPNPNIINQPAQSTATATDLAHKEDSTYVIAAYTMPMMHNIEATVFAGPSFFHLKQDVLSATVASGTQTANASAQSETGSSTGANVGVTFDYLAAANYGVGVFLRWNGASVDLPSAKGVKVGGFQLGVGLRLRF